MESIINSLDIDDNPLQNIHGFIVTHQTHANSGTEKEQKKGWKDKLLSFLSGNFGQKIPEWFFETPDPANIGIKNMIHTSNKS